MRYIKRTTVKELRKDNIALIGWGAGQYAYMQCYNPFMYQLDAMIDVSEKLQGQLWNGVRIEAPESLKRFSHTEKSVCLVIFPNVEDEAIEKASQYLSNFNTIVAPLVIPENAVGEASYSRHQEDAVYRYIFQQLGIESPSYLDVGVCHPIIRNNTYFLYEKGDYEGVLVEPNPEMCNLARIYRPNNTIVEAGVADKEGILKYYVTSNPSLQGQNTFVAERALERGMSLEQYKKISVMSLNHVIEKYCRRTPNLLDLETQGLSYASLETLDTEAHKIDVIRTIVDEKRSEFNDMMGRKGYVHFMELSNGFVYIRKGLLRR